MTIIRSLVPLMMVLAVALVGCKHDTDLYCDQNTPCTPRYPDMPYCDLTGAYPASDGVAHTCIANPRGDAGLCTGTGRTSMCPAQDPICVGGFCVECAASTDCAATKPVCRTSDNTCQGCTSMNDCTGRAGTPFCTGSGACGACRNNADCTTAAMPTCDTTTNMCRACKQDVDCGSNVCDSTTGMCVAEPDAIYVSTTGSGTACTKVAPCGTFVNAMAAVTGTRKWIKVLPGSYMEQIADSAKTVIITGPGADVRPPAFDMPAVALSGSANVTIRGLRIHGASGVSAHGVSCSSAGTPIPLALEAVTIDTNALYGVFASQCTVTISKSTLSGNTGGGVSATSSTVTISQSTLSGNTGGGVSLNTCTFDLVNNFIVKNGSVTSTIGGVYINGTPPAASRLVFNTIADNGDDGTAGNAPGVACSGVSAGAPITLSSDIVSDASDLPVPGSGKCSLWDYSDIFPNAGSGNNNIHADPRFVNTAVGNYHLQNVSPCIDMADPSVAVTVDFDGDVRAATNKDIGADEAR